MAIWNHDLTDGPPQLSDDDARDLVRTLVGIPDLDVTIRATSAWIPPSRRPRQSSVPRQSHVPQVEKTAETLAAVEPFLAGGLGGQEAYAPAL
jgi:hypothetical protein